MEEELGLEELEPIYGEAKAEWSAPTSTLLSPFIFRVHALDPSRLRVQVTDFHSNTWEAVRSVQQLDDMRDSVGIGGSWSEFLDYLAASLKSEDVKLVLDGLSKLNGPAYGRLIAQRSKGMPRISISLSKLEDGSASEAMASLSLELYKAFKSTQNLLANEQEHCVQLMKSISAEQENNQLLQRQLDTTQYSKRPKSHKINDISTSDPASQVSPDKQAAQSLAATKVSNRVVPAYRRAKVRGVLLQDVEDDADN